MPQRNAGRMARPRSGGTSSRSKKPDPTITVSSVLLKVGASLVAWLKGPTGQQLLALASIFFGLVTVSYTHLTLPTTPYV